MGSVAEAHKFQPSPFSDDPVTSSGVPEQIPGSWTSKGGLVQIDIICFNLQLKEKLNSSCLVESLSESSIRQDRLLSVRGDWVGT